MSPAITRGYAGFCGDEKFVERAGSSIDVLGDTTVFGVVHPDHATCSEASL